MEDVVNQFPPINDNNIIIGDPNAIDLCNIVTDAWHCASRIKNPACAQFNSLFMVTGPDFWRFFTTDIPFPENDYPLAPPMPEVPTYTTPAQIKTIEAQHAAGLKQRKDSEIRGAALRNRILHHIS